MLTVSVLNQERNSYVLYITRDELVSSLLFIMFDFVTCRGYSSAEIFPTLIIMIILNGASISISWFVPVSCRTGYPFCV